MSTTLKKLFNNLPVLAWIVIIPLGIILFIGSIITLFAAIATVEGVASILILLVTFVIMRGLQNVPAETKADPTSKFFVALGICFFALMGMAIDQTGNPIYNAPMQIIFCPANSQLSREADISHPLPGRTDISQEFTCVNSNKQVVKQIIIWEILIYRFFQYVVIYYLLQLFVKATNGISIGKKRDTLVEEKRPPVVSE